MKIYCNASNMHIGGGKTLINDFINQAFNKNHIQFFIYVDSRLLLQKNIPKHVKIIRINKFLRFMLVRDACLPNKIYANVTYHLNIICNCIINC